MVWGKILQDVQQKKKIENVSSMKNIFRSNIYSI